MQAGNGSTSGEGTRTRPRAAAGEGTGLGDLAQTCSCETRSGSTGEGHQVPPPLDHTAPSVSANGTRLPGRHALCLFTCPPTPAAPGTARLAYLWSSQSEGLGGRRPGGRPLQGPSHVLGDKGTGERRASSVRSTQSLRGLPPPELINNEQLCIFNSRIVETPVRAATSSPSAGSSSETPAGLRAGPSTLASASGSRWTRARGADPKVAVGGGLTSCSVLAAPGVDGDTSGLGACASGSLAELVCGEKAQKA